MLLKRGIEISSVKTWAKHHPHILTHRKKLFNLWKNQAVYCPNCIVNLSKKELNLHEMNALRFGLNHPILSERVQKDKIKTNVEKLVYTLKRNTDVTVNEELRDEFQFLVKRFTNDAERACSERVNQSLHRTLRSLARNADIKLCKFDKENGFAILEAEDYFLKLDRIIEDGSKFIEAKLQDDAIHPIIQKENSIAYYVKRYLRKVDGYTTLIPSGSKPGKLYGLAKVHKDNTPLRPVVSMVGTPEYKLAKYLDNLIKPHIPDTYLLKSTDNFIERLKQFPCNNSYRIVSFDVASSFTNVPLFETIELIINRLYADGNPYAIPFDKDVFRKLMFMATQGLFIRTNCISR